MDERLREKTSRFNKIIIDITTRCNLNCPVCYMGSKTEKKDLPIEEILGLAHKYRNKVILICGGEPTLRDDLPEIINLFNKRNTVFLVTNGLRLTDYNYLKELKKSGLRYISFSFNGFSDEAYQKINGASLRDIKLKALDNIEKTGIKVILSVLIVKGINEGQIAGVLDYCVKNKDFIDELRIRSMVPFGNHLPCDKYKVFELLGLFCESVGLRQEDILSEVLLQGRLNAALGREIFGLRDCSLSFHLKLAGGRLIPVGKGIGVNNFGNSFRGSAVGVCFEVLRVYGIRMALKGLIKSFLRYEWLPWVHSNNIIKVGLRSWPDSFDFDSEEINKCQTAYYLDSRLVPFCYANLLRSGKI